MYYSFLRSLFLVTSVLFRGCTQWALKFAFMPTNRTSAGNSLLESPPKTSSLVKLTSETCWTILGDNWTCSRISKKEYAHINVTQIEARHRPIQIIILGGYSSANDSEESTSPKIIGNAPIALLHRTVVQEAGRLNSDQRHRSILIPSKILSQL